MTIEFLYRTIGDVMLFATCAWALWRGQTPERLGAVILLISVALTDWVQARHRYWEGPVWDFVTVDVVTLLAFAILSLWSRRIWTLFISAFQLNAVLSHFVGRLPIHVDTYTLITALSLWGGYGLSFALMAGMWQVERRKAFLP